MARIEHEVLIDRRVGDVFAFAVDPDRVPEWQPGVVWMRQTTPGRFGLGSRIAQTRVLHGRRFDIIVECDGYEPDARFGLRMVSGPVAGRMVTTFEAVGTCTRVRLAADVSVTGPLRVLEPLLDRAARRELVADCLRLKRALEGAAGP